MKLYRYLSLSAVFALAVAAKAQYTVTDLGKLSGSGATFAYGVSNNGTVVGQSVSKAFRWSSGGGIVELNGLGGSSSIGYSVNSANQAVGQSETGVGFEYHATLWNNSTSPTDLGTSGQFSTARAINEAGDIAGTRNLRAFRKFNGGSFETLPDRGGTTVGNDINMSGVVTGRSDDSGGVGHAYRWSGGPTLEDLGIPSGVGANSSVGTSINDSGLVGGYYAAGSTFGAFLYDTSFILLSGLYNYENRVWDVNNSGVAVGHSWLSDNGNDSRAVMWLAGSTTAIDLNSLIDPASGWVLQRANGINASGQIVGYGTLRGETRGFILDPVPEPATLFGFGSIILLAVRRRKHR